MYKLIYLTTWFAQAVCNLCSATIFQVYTLVASCGKFHPHLVISFWKPTFAWCFGLRCQWSSPSCRVVPRWWIAALRSWIATTYLHTPSRSFTINNHYLRADQVTLSPEGSVFRSMQWKVLSYRRVFQSNSHPKMDPEVKLFKAPLIAVDLTPSRLVGITLPPWHGVKEPFGGLGSWKRLLQGGRGAKETMNCHLKYRTLVISCGEWQLLSHSHMARYLKDLWTHTAVCINCLSTCFAPLTQQTCLWNKWVALRWFKGQTYECDSEPSLHP